MDVDNEAGLREPDLLYWPRRKTGPVGAWRKEHHSISYHFRDG